MATTIRRTRSLAAIAAVITLALSACGTDEPPTRAEFVDHMLEISSNIGDSNRESWERNYGCVFDATTGTDDDLLVEMMGWDEIDDAEGESREAVNAALGDCIVASSSAADG